MGGDDEGGGGDDPADRLGVVVAVLSVGVGLATDNGRC